MCEFFSFVTLHGEKYYFNWDQRKAVDFKDCDSHSEIVKLHNLTDDAVNCYEYNPLTKKLEVDCQYGEDDSEEVLAWLENLDWKTIVEPLIIKPIINPFTLPKVEKVTDEQIGWLKDWASVGDSVWDSIWASVSVLTSIWASVGDSVGDSVWDSVWDSVRASVRDTIWESIWDSIWALVGDLVWTSVGVSVRAYVGSFFDIDYEYNFTPVIKLWESGLVPSYDGTTWRLHSGKDAKVVYAMRESEE